LQADAKDAAALMCLVRHENGTHSLYAAEEANLQDVLMFEAILRKVESEMLESDG